MVSVFGLNKSCVGHVIKGLVAEAGRRYKKAYNIEPTADLGNEYHEQQEKRGQDFQHNHRYSLWLAEH